MSEWHSTKDAVPASGPHLITGLEDDGTRWYGIAKFYDGEWYDAYEPSISYLFPTHFQSLTVPEHE